VKEWKCSICEKSFRTRKELYQHKEEHKGSNEITKSGKIRKEFTCQYCKRIKLTTIEGNKVHEKFCKLNPQKSVVYNTGKKMPTEQREAISKKMKVHAKEGRLHNIGQNRWKCEPSYPESWFMKVIENEFNDKQYIREFSCGRFSLDFAWVHKMRCIEIDGEQHYQFEEQIQRDKRKDKFLDENGWKVLRIRWKECYNDPKQFIEIAKQFIDNGEIVSFEKRHKTSTEKRNDRRQKYIEQMIVKYGSFAYDSSGRINGSKLPSKIWEERLQCIEKYDKTKFGWISNAVREIGLTRKVIMDTCEHFGIHWRTKRQNMSKIACRKQ